MTNIVTQINLLRYSKLNHRNRICIAGSLDLCVIITIMIFVIMVIEVNLLSNEIFVFAQNTLDNFTQFNNTISISEIATRQVEGDKVRITLSIDTTNKTSKSALEYNIGIINKFLNETINHGLTKININPLSMEILPNYNYSGDLRHISGYTLTNSFQIESSNYTSVSRLMDLAASIGINRIDDVTALLSEQKKKIMMMDLIQDTIQNARNKAEAAISTEGLRIIGLKQITIYNQLIEEVPNNIGYGYRDTQTEKENLQSNIISGRLQLSLSLDVVYYIG